MRSKLTQTTPQKIHIEFKNGSLIWLFLGHKLDKRMSQAWMIKNLIILFAFDRKTYENHTVFHRFYRQLRHFCATNIHAYLGRVIYIVLDNYFNLRRCTINASYCLLEEKLNQGLEFWIETGIESIMYYMLWYDFID